MDVELGEEVSPPVRGVAGDERVFSEVLRAHRAIEVSEFDDLTEVLAAFQAPMLPDGSEMNHDDGVKRQSDS